jgi:hypothetical protein
LSNTDTTHKDFDFDQGHFDHPVLHNDNFFDHVDNIHHDVHSDFVHKDAVHPAP